MLHFAGDFETLSAISLIILITFIVAEAAIEREALENEGEKKRLF